ncbi:hypothetical protein LCGC14_2777250, partial [marine sediment metagenome]
MPYGRRRSWVPPVPSGAMIPGEGPSDARVMLVGERGGAEEDVQRRPFVGPSGQELDRQLARVGIRRSEVYVTNVVKDYQHHSPTLEEVERDTPLLLDEIKMVQPTFIGAVGLYATKFFLGETTMDMAHGVPHWIANMRPRDLDYSVVV